MEVAMSKTVGELEGARVELSLAAILFALSRLRQLARESCEVTCKDEAGDCEHECKMNGRAIARLEDAIVKGGWDE
jgi:hypothetical protein